MHGHRNQMNGSRPAIEPQLLMPYSSQAYITSNF